MRGGGRQAPGSAIDGAWQWSCHETKSIATMLARTLEAALRNHIDDVKRQHDDDLACGLGTVALPDALAVKYPNARREFA